MVVVASFLELQRALDQNEPVITITRNIIADYALVLPPNTELVGRNQEDGSRPMLMFKHSDGIGVTADNQLFDLVIHVPTTKRAIFNAGIVQNQGTFTFKRLKLSGQCAFVMSAASRYANVKIADLNIVAADTRSQLEQPQKYGVNVLQGALTIYNMNPDEASLITTELINITVGQAENPVIGSGIFIGGFGDHGGRVKASVLITNGVYSTGKILFGVADLITGAVFIVNGAHAERIVQEGPTVTYGVNDMVLDAWGTVTDWQVNAPVTSYGPSGVGFVNFGEVQKMTIKAPITTYGLGARGYNQYDGTLVQGDFEDITTYGDGSVGVQISKQVGTLAFHGNIETHGDRGNTLVKGQNVKLPAYALSIKNGGQVGRLVVAGNVVTHGPNVISYLVDNGGQVNELQINGTITATGLHAIPFKCVAGGQTPTIFKTTSPEQTE